MIYNMITSQKTKLPVIDDHRRKQLGFRATSLGLLANIALAVIKTSIGILGHSPALLADGINSISDVAYYVVVTVFMQLAGKPADDEHPYGHRQLESIASLIIGSFVITTAISIFWESINNVFEILSGALEPVGAAQITLYIALFTVLIKIFLMTYTTRIGTETQNPVVLALAYDHRNDMFTASAAFIGIGLSQLGYPIFDPLAGAIVALVILRTGIKIIRESADDLMDTVPGITLAEQIRSLLTSLSDIQEVEEIHAHRFGPFLVVNLTIGIDGNLTVYHGDQISTKVEEILISNITNLRRVHVHYHPSSNKK